MTTSIKNKLLSGIIWNAIEKVLVKGSAFAIGVILARLLSPSDFGLIGMLSVFIAISTIFIESGFAKALIQNQHCREEDYSTAFWTNVIISVVIYIILYFTSPLIAAFYDEPQLISITRVFAINFILGSFNIVQRAKLMAEVNFKALAKINFIGTISGGVVGILFAWLGYGVWSLVGQTISSTLAMMCVFPFFSKWKPNFIFSTTSFKWLYNFGSKLLVTGVISVIINNIATIAIGKYYKSKELGFYTRASQFSELVSGVIYEVLGTVSFPVMSSIHEDKDSLVALYKKILFATALTTFPVMVLMALLAKPLIVVLLTEKWLPCVFMLQILCLARMFTPLSALNMNILNAVGRSDLYMKLDMSKIPLNILVLVITIPLGTEAIVIGNLVSTFICFFINGYLPGKMFGYGPIKQLKDWKYIIISLINMTLVVWLVENLIHNSWLQLIIGGILGLIIYVGSCMMLYKINFKQLMALKNEFRK